MLRQSLLHYSQKKINDKLRKHEHRVGHILGDTESPSISKIKLFVVEKQRQTIFHKNREKREGESPNI